MATSNWPAKAFKFVGFSAKNRIVSDVFLSILIFANQTIPLELPQLGLICQTWVGPKWEIPQFHPNASFDAEIYLENHL